MGSSSRGLAARERQHQQHQLLGQEDSSECGEQVQELLCVLMVAGWQLQGRVLDECVSVPLVSHCHSAWRVL
jgi:hypothetical protein